MDVQDSLTIARAELELARRLVHDEIRDYPTPISGCDAQYNHLIGLRGSIADALRALEAPRFVATPRQMTPGERVESR